jgi:small-conductance mechanosensitive channel
LKDPSPVIGIAELGDSCITLAIKPWVSVEDFVIAQAEGYQSVLSRFHEKKIEIPGPRTVVRLINNP